MKHTVPCVTAKMLKRHTVARLFWLTLLITCLSTNCLSQSVTVRIIDGANGSPLSQRRVDVSLLYDKKEEIRTQQLHLQLTTNGAGDARFTLPEPTPEHIAVQVHIGDSWQCGCSAVEATSKVIEHGFSGIPPHKSEAVTATAGTMIFIARRLTLWERIVQPFVKD